MAETIFTKILAGQIPCHRVYEDEHVLAFLDIAPLIRGHTLVIPKDNEKDLAEIPANIKRNLTIIPVDHMDHVLVTALALDDPEAFLREGDHEGEPVEDLTERQREILQLIAEGQSTKEIAGILEAGHTRQQPVNELPTPAGVN